MANEELHDDSELIRRFDEATSAFHAYLAARGASKQNARAKLDEALRAIVAARAALEGDVHR